MELPRRTVLAGGLGVLLQGCVPAPWEPSPGDVEPRVKLAAVRHVEGRGARGDQVLEVLEAQYGGLLTDSASVIVVTRTASLSRQRWLRAGYTYDVRLVRSGRSWTVVDVLPSRSGPAAAELSRAAHAVLGSPRIKLPPAGRLDVASGKVHDAVLDAMLAVARRHRIRVSVVRSGHPLRVFGTTRLSDHPQGLAFDTWAIDGHPVVAPLTPRGLVADYMHDLADAGSYNVGGPYLLGSAPQWFSDPTHHDHVHAGFRD